MAPIDSTAQGGGPILQTVCPLDCPDSCSMTVEVDAARTRVVKLDGDRRNPVTAGTICGKVRRFPQLVHGPDRLLRPAIRTGPKGSDAFREVGWDEALDRVAHELLEAKRRHGAESILPLSYGGSNGFLSQDTTDALLFERLGASRLARTVCAAAVGRALDGLYGKMPGVSYGDVPEARLIVVWGANPSDAGIHLVPKILEAQRRGARLVVIDPRRTPLAARADQSAGDLHLAVRPGTDLVLALAVIRHLFDSGAVDTDFLARHTTGAEELRRRASRWTLEEAASICGLEASDVEAFATLYAESSPALIRLGWGQERNRNGGSASAAILALPAVAGKFGVRGGGYLASNSGSLRLRPLVEPNLEGADADAGITPPRTVNMNRIGRLLADPSPDEVPVRCLFVYNCNPLQTLPRQDLVRRGLERDDLFTVVFDPVRTDTARYADVILPATTFLEQRDLRRGYGAYVLGDVEPVIAPCGEARPNVDVFAALCRRCGVLRDDDPVTADALRERALEQLDPDTRERLEADGVTPPPCGEAPVQMVDLLPQTTDGKIHLVPPALDDEARASGVADGLYGFRPPPGLSTGGESAGQARPADQALTLISPASRQAISSSLFHLVERQAVVDLHVDDAAARGVDSGDRVRLRGLDIEQEVVVRARVGTVVRPGVASLPKGLWSRHTECGGTANAFAPDSLTDLGGGACFNDARVVVSRIESDELASA